MFAALVAVLLWSWAPPLIHCRQVSCEEARLKCAYRTGCGMALQKFIVGCSTVLRDAPDRCPEECQHALIALTSTDEGKDLMACACTDEMCEETKERAEVCRPHVTRATRNESIVSCRVAEWICSADGVCSTALDYYHHYCRSMFQGRKCSNRCKNSISILRRQEKAAKLTTCVCDGREGYNCEEIRANMARLCYHKLPPATPPPTPTPPPDIPQQEPSSAATFLPPPPVVAVLLLLSWCLAS